MDLSSLILNSIMDFFLNTGRALTASLEVNMSCLQLFVSFALTGSIMCSDETISFSYYLHYFCVSRNLLGLGPNCCTDNNGSGITITHNNLELYIKEVEFYSVGYFILQRRKKEASLKLFA